MNKIFIVHISFLLCFYTFSSEKIRCQYGQYNTCPTGMYCVFVDVQNQAICKKQFTNKLPDIVFPFKKPATCWKGADYNKNSSHAWINSKYALDLHSKKEERNNIYAGLAGKIIARGGCKEQDPRCNGAFGNQIKIFAQNGIMVFYAHLSEIYVTTGDKVSAGQLIGKEGATGNVGDMWGETHDFHHLHLSVHYNWNNIQEKYHNNPWPNTPSIPFKVKVCDQEKKPSCFPISLDIRNLDCTKFSKSALPIHAP